MDNNLMVTGERVADTRRFEEQVAPFRREIVGHCYRFLGSLADADDLAQESLLRVRDQIQGAQVSAPFGRYRTAFEVVSILGGGIGVHPDEAESAGEKKA